jgi:hypothetical protein
MAPEGQVGQKEMKCKLKFKKYFHMSQYYSGERCGPWASCFYTKMFEIVTRLFRWHKTFCLVILILMLYLPFKTINFGHKFSML